ncbi:MULTISPECIES: putative holin-like toxin [Jeotgalibacillus]
MTTFEGIMMMIAFSGLVVSILSFNKKE